MLADNSRRAVQLGLSGAVALLLSLQLFVPPALSVADNNDFQKLAGRACLAPDPGTGPQLFDYAVLHWHFAPAACAKWPFRSTAEVFLLAAEGLNRVFHSRTAFDMRFMGLVYAPILWIGFVFSSRSLAGMPFKAAVTAQLAWILVTCNAVYVPWLNTFYFDAVTLAAVTAALVGVSEVVLGRRRGATHLVITSGWLALIAGSKAQHSIIGVLCIPALWFTAGRQGFAPIWARVAATALVLAGVTLSVGTTPRAYTADATFSALFYRILPQVRQPVRYLAETRIPPAWIAFTGKHAFASDSPLADNAAEARFAEWFGPTDLIRLYLRHPLAAWTVAHVNLDEASLDRVRMKTGAVEHRLGNYEASTGKAPQTLSYFLCIWPWLKSGIFGGRPVVYLLYIIGMITAAWRLAPPVDGMRFLLATVTAVMAAEWALAMLDGVESGRHLLLFNYFLDLVACANAFFVALKIAQRGQTTGAT